MFQSRLPFMNPELLTKLHSCCIQNCNSWNDGTHMACPSLNALHPAQSNAAMAIRRWR